MSLMIFSQGDSAEYVAKSPLTVIFSERHKRLFALGWCIYEWLSAIQNENGEVFFPHQANSASNVTFDFVFDLEKNLTFKSTKTLAKENPSNFLCLSSMHHCTLKHFCKVHGDFCLWMQLYLALPLHSRWPWGNKLGCRWVPATLCCQKNAFFPFLPRKSDK